MRTTVDFTVLETDRDAAVAIACGSLTGRGFRVDERPDGTFVAVRGSHVLTTVFGALVPVARRYRRYELVVTPGNGSVRLTLRQAEHGTAIAGGPIAARERGTAWNLTADGVEFALSVAGMLVHRADGVPEPA